MPIRTIITTAAATVVGQSGEMIEVRSPALRWNLQYRKNLPPQGGTTNISPGCASITTTAASSSSPSTVVVPKRKDQRSTARSNGNGHFPKGLGGGDGGGNKPQGSGGGDDGHDDDKPEPFVPGRYRLGMWVGIASILMLFVGLISAYIVRAGTGGDWRRIEIPSSVWASTALILLSSVSFEVARQALKRNQSAAYAAWLVLTLLLGFGFLAAQLFAWQQLIGQGVYLASNPYSSFFYLFTGTHAAHLLGGILALNLLLVRYMRNRRKPHSEEYKLRQHTSTETVALYWHFMDGLWICLLLLLLWR